jgi:hypothetical protein
MILTAMPTQVDDHPLAGLSTDQRDLVRAQAFGRVLAAIAIRKTGPQSPESEAADGQQDVGRRFPTSPSDEAHRKGN